MIALMDTIACIKTTASPSKDPKSLFEDPAEFTEILKDQKHVILLQILITEKLVTYWERPEPVTLPSMCVLLLEVSVHIN